MDLVVIAITAGLIICFGLGALLGAPFLPTHRQIVGPALDLAQLKPGDRLLDLGCGIGTLMVAASKLGIRSTGYEINPLLWLIAAIRLLPYRRLARVKYGDYWRADWPQVDAIYVFLIGHYMAKLERELDRRIKTPTKVVTYTFKLPNRQATKQSRGLSLYLLP